MSRHARLIDADTADGILAGGAVGPPGLAELLRAASAPARPAELAREEAALVAFRMAAGAPATAGEGVRTRSGSVWARIVTMKAVAAVVAVALGGVAVAASVGLVPGPLGRPGTDTSTDHPSLTPGPTPRTEDGYGGGVPPSPHPTPPAKLVGLCHSLRAEADPAAIDTDPRYADLIAAAGGVRNVPAYCVTVIEGVGKENRQPESNPTGNGSTGSNPTGHSHPTGQPSHPATTPSLPSQTRTQRLSRRNG